MNAKKTILLVDDEVILAMTGKMSLEKYGYDVVVANNGEKAIEQCSVNNSIDLILMDIDLGKGIDGPEAASTILKERDIPIVFLSSHIEPEVVEKTEKITSYGYVVKNSGITVLDASIKMAFKLYEAKELIWKSDIKQKALISNISDVIAVIGTDGTVKYTSSNVEKLFGWKETELFGIDGWITVYPDDLERIQNQFVLLLQKDNASATQEFRYKCKDGTYKSIKMTATNLTKDPFINGVLLNYHDITERKQTEEALLKKMEELQRFQQLTVNRELTMIELKKEINELLVKAGLEEKYRIVR